MYKVTQVNVLQKGGQSITIYLQGKKMQLKYMIGTTSFYTEMTFQGLVSSVMETLKSIQKRIIMHKK